MFSLRANKHFPSDVKNQRNISRHSTAIGADQRLISCSLMKFNVGQVPTVNIHTAEENTHYSFPKIYTTSSVLVPCEVVSFYFVSLEAQVGMKREPVVRMSLFPRLF